MDKDDVYAAIKVYFAMGLLYTDIINVMAMEHGVLISLRHLKRMLRQIGLFRRKNYSNIGDVVDFVHSQIANSGQLHGYRWMYEKCRAHNIHCKKEDIRVILGILDPEGTAQRRKRRLLRRSYSSKGPDYLWHIDSYDKLSRYGICINGCVDGFSRRVMWLNVYHTNSDPRMIGGYYLEVVQSLCGCPRIIRGDAGTENTYVRDIQRFLRLDNDDAMAGYNSYMEGRSTANQRIEYWWSFLRRECTDYWICLFRRLLDQGDFGGTFLDVNLMRFCFMHLIQDDLDSTMKTWNRHLIRPSRNANSPSGRPDIMYHIPELYGTIGYLCEVSSQQIDVCKEECSFRGPVPCDKDVYDMSCLLIKENRYQYPNDPDSAVYLYRELRRMISAVIM